MPRYSRNWPETRALTARAVVVGLGAATALGCGGGVPLLHTVHALAPGHTSFGVGVSDRLALGIEQRALDRARLRSPDAPLPPASDRAYTRGLLVALAEGPALAPWVAARIGISGSNEAGLSYTGQALRADVRHAVEWPHTALSIGLGVTGQGLGARAPDLPGVDLGGAKGVGVDLPLLLGYRSDADLISAWVGVRGSYDHWSGRVALEPGDAPRFELGAQRLSAGPVLGVAVGLYPVWVAAELELDYAHVTGNLDSPGRHYDAQVDGWSVHPAGALLAKF